MEILGLKLFVTENGKLLQTNI